MRDEELSLFIKAIRFASEKHKDQRRKGKEASPYINHPILVADILWSIGGIRDYKVLISAILHDTVEDTNTSPDDIESIFGKDIRKIVEEVTDDKSLPKMDRKRLQIETASHKSLEAKLVKLGDKISNIQDILKNPPVDWSIERRNEYLEWAKAVVDEIRGTNITLENYFDEYYKSYFNK